MKTNEEQLDSFLKEIYKKNDKKWRFDLFNIVCKKCNSNLVEFNSDMEIGTGYYHEAESEGGIIIKCHGCGNAFKIESYTLMN